MENVKGHRFDVLPLQRSVSDLVKSLCKISQRFAVLYEIKFNNISITFYTSQLFD